MHIFKVFFGSLIMEQKDERNIAAFIRSMTHVDITDLHSVIVA